MPVVGFDYRFTISLPARAETAYRWATDYQPDDLVRMGQVGHRRVEKVAEGTIVLTDIVRTDHGTVTKKRLVRLQPRLRSWTNTHLAGPMRHSQFLYRIVPKGSRRSTLEFVGLQVEHTPRTLSAQELARRARAVAREDKGVWRHLVRAMTDELGRPRRGRGDGRSKRPFRGPRSGRRPRRPREVK